jgi:hypothetical protein
MAAASFSPGFRLSLTDSAVILTGAIGTVLAAQVEWWMGASIGFVVGHFFLFCNVLRAARPLELAWSACFLALTITNIATGKPGWTATFGASLLVTLVVLMLQLRRPSYHGIAWQRINPGLLQWWESQHAAPGSAVSEKPISGDDK